MANLKRRIELFGIKINDISLKDVLSEIRGFIDKNQPAIIFTANANHVRILKRDPDFARAYSNATIVTADGIPLIWASRILGRPIFEQVAGSDLVIEICKNSAELGFKIFLLGAAVGVAEMAKKNCEKRYPGSCVAGFYSPTRSEILSDEKNRIIVERINGSGANIVLVGFGPPLQEKWIEKYSPILHAPVAIGVGGSIDYLAGTIKRPPLLIRRIGMEWLARLIQDPRRYWKRYIYDMKVFYYIFVEILKNLKS